MSAHPAPRPFSPKWLMACGYLLQKSEFLDRLGWDNDTLRSAVRAGGIFCLHFGAHCYYPSFYADARYQRAQVEAVAKLLGNRPPGAKLLFFLTPKGSLSGATPLEAIALGQFGEACVAAEGYGLP